MLADDLHLQWTLDRIAWFYGQVRTVRKTETNPVNYRASVSGFLAEIDRMQSEVREYLSVPEPEQRGKPAAVLAALEAAPHVPAEWVDELERRIAARGRPAEHLDSGA
jgi:hypothetical protein